MPRPPRKQTGSRSPGSRTRSARRPGGPYKHGAIPVIGLIGPIGAGKSRVAALLAEAGAQVIDADVVGHALLEQSPVRDVVAARFGQRVLAPSETPGEPPHIDRRALGAIVFADRAARAQLEAIVHPRMRRTFERAIARAVRRGRDRAVVLDAAILLEAGWNTLCDQVILVDAPPDQRLARVAATRGWTAETLAAREAAQWPLEKKRAQADRVIANDATVESLAESVRRLAATLFPSPRPPRPGRSQAQASPQKPAAVTASVPESQSDPDPREGSTAAEPRRP